MPRRSRSLQGCNLTCLLGCGQVKAGSAGALAPSARLLSVPDARRVGVHHEEGFTGGTAGASCDNPRTHTHTEG